MAVQLNHTIVWAHDSRAAAAAVAALLGRPAPTPFGPFLVVDMDNGVSLDFLDAEGDGEVAPQHYAFLVGEPEFDEIFGRIRAEGLAYWADPGCTQLGQINHHDGGRGVYWRGPSGHLLEIITRPYGSG